jgi:hypothetical protein
MDNVFDSIMNCKKTMLNPTILYNEGWMVRLLVEYSIKENITIEEINFGSINNWTSEALISSPFVNAPELREGYTHADIAIGDFSIDYEKRGELTISDNAKIFGVIEAKMKSNLSKGTSNFTEYNQASRNVTCIAKTLLGNNCKSYFIIVAPEAMIEKHKINEQINIDKIIDQVEKRFDIYDNSFKTKESYSEIIEHIQSMTIISLSYEKWIDKFTNLQTKKKLENFYLSCKKWNRI